MAVEALAKDDELPEEEAKDAPEDGEAEGEAQPGKKFRLPIPDFRKMNKLMLGGIGLGVLLVVGGLVYFLFFMGGGSAGTDEHAAAAPVTIPIYFYNLPEMVVNLSDEGNGNHFLKLNISLEVADETVAAQIEPYLPRVLDAFQTYLRELRLSDLEGSAGIYQLKEELLRRINIAVHPAVVDSILFREILVQ